MPRIKAESIEAHKDLIRRELLEATHGILAETKTADISLAEVAARAGIGRTTFYEYKKRFEEQGLEGLKDLPPIHKSLPFATPPEVVARILELSLQQPARGCNWISAQLRLEGISVSYPTVQKILNEHGETRGFSLSTCRAAEVNPREPRAQPGTETLSAIPALREGHSGNRP